MSADANENVTVATDRMPAPVATIWSFRPPWIAGDDSCGECGECGEFFREHWWVDAGDHGHTVCRLPKRTPEWVKITPEQVALLPDRTPVRVEEGGVVTEGLLSREATNAIAIYLHYGNGGHQWAGYLGVVTVHARPQDVPDDDADIGRIRAGSPSRVTVPRPQDVDDALRKEER